VTRDGLTPADVDSVAHLVVEPETLRGVGQFFIADGAYHHLRNVLRVNSGERVTLTDGNGCWVETVVGASFPAQSLERVSETHHSVRPAVDTEVAFAVTKADKPELVVQKLTELGIGAIAVLIADRSVARWDAEKMQRNVDRFRVISTQAVQQSRQVWLPRISMADSLDAYVLAVSAYPAAVVVRCDRGGEPALEAFDRFAADNRRRVAVAVGPEGGWSDREREILTASIELTRSVLRAETAAIVAGTLLSVKLR
jgi:16S rRNA (uracil1498-N3)-methyltransferase